MPINILDNQTVLGTLSSSSIIYDGNGGNSVLWDSAYNVSTGLQSLSSNWQSTYVTVCALSGNWNAAYASTTALNLSSGKWNNVYTLINTTTATTFNVNNLSATGTVYANSVSVPTISANNTYSSGNQYVISDGAGNNNTGNGANTISLNALSGTYIGSNLTVKGNLSAVSANLGTTATIAPLNISPLTITAAASGSVFNQIQNTVAGVSASTDISLYNDDGINYLDLGIASTKYNGNIYGPTFNVVNAGDSYVYATSGNLVHGTAATTGNLTFFTGGTLSGNERMRITNTGNVGIGTTTPNSKLTVVGNVSATSYYGDGSNLSNVPYTLNTSISTITPTFGNNTVSGTYANNSVIGSGCNNQICNPNYIASPWTGGSCSNAIVGGNTNTIFGGASIVGGGTGNSVCSCNSAVLAGACNSVRTIGGGFSNTSCSLIAGGNNNLIYSSAAYDGIHTIRSNANNSAIVGGAYNTIADTNSNVATSSTTNSNYNTIVGGLSGCINNNSSYNFIGGGCRNSVCGNYNNIIGGRGNSILSGSNNFILGSNISVSANNFTFVNNISSTGNIYGVYYGDGSNLTGVSNYQGTDIKALTGNWQSTYATVCALSANWNTAYVISTALNLSAGNWNSVYTTVQNSSAGWGISNYQGTDIKALTGNWQSTYATVCALSANWNTAYNVATAYQSISSTFITKTVANASYLPLSGGTITGQLNVAGVVTASGSNVNVNVVNTSTNWTFSNADNNNVLHFNTNSSNLTAAIPSTLQAGFNVALMNTGSNSVILSSNRTIFAAGSSISNGYGGALIYTDSSNNIYAVGKLF
jgi:hypothetical protein